MLDVIYCYITYILLVIAIAKCQRAKQKLEDDRTEFCKYWELAL